MECEREACPWGTKQSRGPVARWASQALDAVVTRDAAWPKARRRPALRAALALRVGGVKETRPYEGVALLIARKNVLR